MVIETERLTLRKFIANDAEEFFKITRDEKIRKYVPYACNDSIEETRSDIIKYYLPSDFIHDFYLVIELKETNEIIGAIIVTQSMHSYEFDVSLIISSGYRRKGYISEALNGFIKTLPKGMVLLFLIEKDNTASLKTVSKLGAIESYTALKNKRKFLYVIE